MQSPNRIDPAEVRILHLLQVLLIDPASELSISCVPSGTVTETQMSTATTWPDAAVALVPQSDLTVTAQRTVGGDVRRGFRISRSASTALPVRPTLAHPVTALRSEQVRSEKSAGECYREGQRSRWACLVSQVSGIC